MQKSIIIFYFKPLISPLDRPFFNKKNRPFYLKILAAIFKCPWNAVCLQAI